MYMKKNISHGPILPLAIVTMIVLLVPVFFVSNTSSKLRNAEAAFPSRVRVPTNEPNYRMEETNPTKPSPSTSATPKSYPVRTSAPTYY